MSLFNINIKFKLLVKEYTFKIETKHSATSLKDNSLKLVGLVDIDELKDLTKWYRSIVFSQDSYEYKVNKITATANDKTLLGIFPTSMSFTPSKTFNDKWQAHIIINYDCYRERNTTNDNY